MRILLLGASGLLGRNWIEKTSLNSKIIALIHNNDFKNNDVDKIYVKNIFEDRFYDQISTISPSLILNFLAYTNVDKCEKNINIANKINHIFPEKISKYANEKNIKFVHISTDQLFDGKKNNYTEIDNYSPLNYYAYTKMMAEKKILINNPNALIIRTNFFCKGFDYRLTLSDFIVNSFINKTTISLFDDVIYNPLYIDILIDIIQKLINKNASGLFNVSSNEIISKYEFGQILSKKMNINNDYFLKSKLKKSNLVAKRPLNMTLSNTKLINTIGIKIPHIENQIESLSKNYL